MSDQVIDSSGRVALPSAVMSAVGTRRMTIASFSPHHVLLGGSEGAGASIAGKLGEVTVTDLLSFYNMFRKTGCLYFSLKGGAKELYFKDGEIVYAQSSFPSENLAMILYDLGKIDQAMLKKMHEIGLNKVPIGKVLVEKGVVTPKDLWLAARQQVESVIFNLFAFAEGNFCFLNVKPEEEKIVRLSMNTQNLIMEGLRRVDERALYMRDIRSLDTIPVLSDQRGQKLSNEEQLLLGLIRENEINVRELLRRSGLGEFEALRNLHQLLRKKVVILEEPIVAEVAGELGDLIAIFNGAFVSLSRQITVIAPTFLEEVQLFVRDLPPPYSYVFRDVHVRENGSVDAGRVMANLDGLEEGDKKRLLADALSEVVYMECIVAREKLPTEESNELIKRVQKISERVKSLVGRSE